VGREKKKNKKENRNNQLRIKAIKLGEKRRAAEEDRAGSGEEVVREARQKVGSVVVELKKTDNGYTTGPSFLTGEGKKGLSRKRCREKEGVTVKRK